MSEVEKTVKRSITCLILPAANEKCYAVQYLEKTYFLLRHHLGQTSTKKVDLYILNEEIVKPNLKLYCSI